MATAPKSMLWVGLWVVLWTVCLEPGLVRVSATDADMLQTFCVADFNQSAPRMNGFACKDPAEVTSQDFLFNNFQAKVDPNTSQTKAVVTFATIRQFPGLNTLGIAHAKLDFAPGGVIVPHTHPLATETIYVLYGTIYTGFVSFEGVLYAETLTAGGMYVFPKATLHFQINVGDGPAASLNSFNGQNPTIPAPIEQLLATNISDAVLTASFNVNQSTIDILKAAVFSPFG